MVLVQLARFRARARVQELDLFPLQKIALSDVILARTIHVCCRELSKYVKTNKYLEKYYRNRKREARDFEKVKAYTNRAV